MVATLISVNVVHALIRGRWDTTAIDKRPVAGPVQVGELGVVGDRQMQRGHGGPDKAVYAYATEDAAWWAERLGHEVTPGYFGENLTTRGLEVTDALIGETWAIGEVELEVRMPRTPCENLSKRVGIDDFHLEFNATARVGALLKVIRPASVESGTTIRITHRPAHQVSVGDWARGATPAQATALLDSGVPLARNVRSKARRLAATA